ncbi:hypothetical protein PS662_01781 [Pseudomonas fluorescens]|uniref:Uncharacterized protein n=1 Tax=Pseudomonas fluorescens TaxID=294 RepID=A0A5E6RRB2_PSEFL|nr:hypothetical protein PS662_01781 [Pseudomonas fluorescens]
MAMNHGMRACGRRRWRILVHLGASQRTMGKITPNSNLIFEIELLEMLTRDE